MADNTQAWLSYLQDPNQGLGLAPHQAYGVMANLLHESGAGLPAWGPTGDNGTAFGTAQWRGDRFRGLQQYAAANGLDFKSPEAQMGFMRQELQGPYSGAFNALKAAKTPQEAATAFNKRYEISADNTGGREATADALANGSDPVAAINAAAGIRRAGGGGGALAFSGDDNSDSEDNGGALSPGKGALRTIFEGEKPDRNAVIGSTLANMAASLAGISSPAQAQGLRSLAQDITRNAQSKYQTQIGADGTVYRKNTDTGEVQAIQGPGQAKETYTPIIDKETGRVIGSFSHNKGTANYFGGNGPAAPLVGGDPELTGQERYDSLTTQEKKQIDAWQAGTGIQPSQYAMRNPTTRKMVDAANAIGIDMTRYGERQAFLKGMASKSLVTAGGQFISAPTVMDHLLNAANDYLKLGNSSGGGYSTGAAVANFAKDMAGGTDRQAKQTSTDRDTDTASKEIVSFLTRGHGGVTERQDTHDKLYMPRAAPEVQAAALEAYRKQVADRFYELADGAKGSAGNHPEILKAEAAFKAKDAELQDVISRLRSGKAPAANATPAQAGARPPLSEIFRQ